MKKIFLLLFFASITGLFAQEQDCTQDENVKRFMVRGRAALKVAEKPEDYKLAADEFQKALEYSPKCPEVHYNLGLCYEETGKLDPGNYQEAISYLNNYLSFKPDAENKDEVQEKIYELEFLIEKTGCGLKCLTGNWKFYWGDGKIPEGNKEGLFDIRFFENNGIYYAEYTSFKVSGGFLPMHEKTTCDIKYTDGVISFAFNSIFRFLKCCVPRTKTYYTASEDLWSGKYELKFDNKGTLTGHRILDERYSAFTVGFNKQGDEKMNVETDCSGNCGNTTVYFVKQ